MPILINYGPAILILFSIFFGIFMNRRGYNVLREDMNRRFIELRSHMNGRFARVDRRFDSVEARLEKFTVLEGRVQELSSRR